MKKVPNCSIHDSITMLGRDKVLLGRCWGLSPQLKSVEVSFLPNMVHELQSILFVKPLKKWYTLWDPDLSGAWGCAMEVKDVPASHETGHEPGLWAETRRGLHSRGTRCKGFGHG